MAQVAQISNYRNNSAAQPALAPTPTKATAPKHRNLTAVPAETEARGFALYLGVDEATARAAGTSLTEIASALKATFAQLVPQAANETYAAVALAPKSARGRSIDIVRAALQDPRALEKLVEPEPENVGIKVDFARKRISRDGEVIDATVKEFALLAYLIDNPDRVIEREELVEAISHEGETETATARSIDVHVRRLRTKISGYEDIIRTVRGGGYKYSAHPDVQLER